ncbi:MAG: hypothetical protein LBM99_00240, partial [Bacillales bacterium]|nr:hypothetical protein [Bacillales bacterium]
MTYFYSVQVNNQVASIYRSEQIISANTLVVVETIRGTEVGLCSNPLKGSESFKVPEVFRY